MRFNQSGFRKRRQVRHGESVPRRTAALQSPESFRGEKFVSIRVHSWLALRLQYTYEMSQFVFYVAGHRDRVSDFFPQQQPISLTQTIKRLLDSVFAHAHSLGDLRL